MKKFLIILVVIAAIGLALALSIGFLVTKGVNTFAPKITGTKVTLDSAFILPTGSGTLSGLFVGNPEGWSGDKAFYLGKVHVSVAPLSIFGDHVVIKDVLIDSPQFVYETKFTGSNIQDLLNNINKSIGGSSSSGTNSSATAATPEKAAAPRKFEIKRFVLQNAKISVGVGPAVITLPMPTLTLVDLGTKEGGITANELVYKIMTNILGQIGDTVAHSASQLGGAVSDSVTGAVSNGIKNLFKK